MPHLLIHHELVPLVPVLAAYVGPDQILPVTSVLAGIIGVVLMVWHRLVAVASKGLRLLRGRAQPVPKRSDQ